MKKFRHLWLSILTLILSVSIIIGGAGLSAFAADSTPIITSSDTTAVVLPSSVELGKEVTVGVENATVTAPNGLPVTLEGGKFVAEILGNYIIEYTDAGKTQKYTHTVNVKLASDYELRVFADGADIPTYIDTETDCTLPSAALYKKNDDGEYVKLKEGTDYTLAVYINNEKKDIDGKYKFVRGKNSVQYDAVLANTNKHFTKQYDVNAQDNFEDKVRPTISISGVPTDASLNTKVTLPKATATDNFDSNVRIKVSVSFEGQPVKKVNVNEFGYAYEDKTEDETFDNVYDMTFYPRKAGTYVVEYQAIDDSGKTSVKQPFNIKVQDRTAPKLEKIADDQIPATWGLKVVNEKSDPASSVIKFPYPEYSDNSSDVSVSFEIRDTVNNNTVIRFENIYATEGDGAEYTYSESTPSKGLYDSGKKETFTKNGFEFDFNNYKLDSKYTKTGKYTVIYNARDTKPNSTTKSYDIDLQDTFTDRIAPSVELNADKYIYVSNTETKYALPTATISDAIDSKPTVVYKVIEGTVAGEDFTAATGAEGFIVENGEEISVRCDDTKVYVKYGDKKEYSFALANGKYLQLSVTATDNAGNSTPVSRNVKLAVASDFKDDTNVALDIDSTELTIASPFDIADTAKLGKISVGKFDEAYRDFVGFEIYMKNPAGDIISGLDFETYVYENAGKYSIAIDDIKIALSKVTKEQEKYVLTVRAFDITGRSTVKTFDIKTTGDETGDDDYTSAAAIAPEGNINVAYRLKNERAKTPNIVDTKKYIVRRISDAGRCSLMGLEFTAYTTGKVWFTDGYYKKQRDADVNGAFTALGDKYSLNATDNSTPVFEILGRMPVQDEKAVKTADYKDDLTKWVELPEVVAYNEYANAKISLRVSTPSSSSRTYRYDPETNNNTDSEYIQYTNNKFYFFATEDGEYTVEFVASVGGSEEARSSYKIRIGDTVPPAFKVTGSNYGATARQNGKFSFNVVELTEQSDINDISDITFTKRLLDPSGNEVYSVSDKGNTGATKTTPSKDETYTFTMTGTYTVEYTVTDKANNSSVYQDTINVSATDSTNAMPLKVLRTVLIIVGVILIAGVILYFVRFRKVKDDGNKASKK